jgi:hypothetical protein
MSHDASQIGWFRNFGYKDWKCSSIFYFLLGFTKIYTENLYALPITQVRKWGMLFKKSLKIPKGQSESVYRRRTDNTMAKRKSTKGQTTIYKTCI